MWWLGLAFVALISGCERDDGWQQGQTFSARAMSFDELPLWQDQQESNRNALRAFLAACEGMAQRNYELASPSPLLAVPPRHWRTLCDAAQTLTGEDAQTRFFFENFFQPYELRAERKSLLTGYYEPQLEGARQKSDRFHVPLYARPHDLLQLTGEDFGLPDVTLWGKAQDGRFVPYDTRGEVMAGSLAERAEPLAWLDNDTDAFFFAIQGSGRIRLRDGSLLRLGYDARNGHPYHSLGRSQKSLRKFLEQHPERTDEILAANPSYIFFRELSQLSEDEGPIGAFGVSLVAEHSLAVDDAFIPLGIPLWLVLQHPLHEESIGRIMMALDKGAAIKGALRGDVFWGSGKGAFAIARRTKTQGRFFILLPHSEHLEELP